MGYTQYNITSNATAYVDQDNPNANYHTGELLYAAESPGGIHRKYAFIKFPNMPDMAGKMIGTLPSKKDGRIVFDIQSASSDGPKWWGYCESPWDMNTVNYNNKPSYTRLATYPSGVQDPYPPVTESIYEKIRQYGIVIGVDSPISPFTYSCYSMNSAQAPSVSFTLFDSIPIVTPIAPLRKFIDALADTTFEWIYSNEYADSQKSYVIQISADGVSWTELSAEETSATSVVIPAGTLTYTTKYWRIKVVSQYDFESEWSAAVQIVVTSPSVCILSSVTSSPRPVVTWSCEGQQAFQARFGDYETGSIFSTSKTYKCPIYLEDGIHTVSVQTQGTNGLWSQWVSQTITVENVPGDAIVLIGFPSHHARLSWSGGGDGDFYILRDGVPIGKTDANEYTDSFVIGKHSYQVLEQFSDENYTMSNKVTMTLVASNNMISPVSAAAWQDLKYSLDKSPTFGESHAQTGALIHYAGRKYPVFESSGFEDKTLSFTVAFKTQKEATEFGQLLGQTVCYKSKIGRMIVGVLDSYSVETNRRYSQYSFTIKQTDYREEIAYE